MGDHWGSPRADYTFILFILYSSSQLDDHISSTDTTSSASSTTYTTTGSRTVHTIASLIFDSYFSTLLFGSAGTRILVPCMFN